ncbi:pre-mRNA-splicing factor 3 [Striga asiatica]|uniref:Pre-mRNA-splicing factor 3 n=1 Tax=Striga asiatica TaxID=4170 RepID=A0A5A7R179_STRAF|nr:pre-mRNA-splicing factor 3 [Striga asiatica]
MRLNRQSLRPNAMSVSDSSTSSISFSDSLILSILKRDEGDKRKERDETNDTRGRSAEDRRGLEDLERAPTEARTISVAVDPRVKMSNRAISVVIPFTVILCGSRATTV